ncbi:kinase D-interacting substrate of 220 kDa B [Galendromus occidentalis]|uniref:Kinase D-interacting substrate of 220 kDa B n=1 Tax=Galendromus occidentalis TaxID=34638 RepID=A0AAJ7SHK0_9ACAR|nr:kinase D-interacting substrate of 220 kDa B [Galendromus occidentalis]
MLNPKDLRMSLRREKKQVNFDSTAQPQSRPSAMFEAAAAWIKTGEVSSVRESLKNRSLMCEERDENGQTLLLLAAQAGQASLCGDFLRHGWDPNAEDCDGWTALHNAAKEGFYDVLVLLITQGASIECRDGTGWTPLMWACYRGHLRIARFLLENGAFTNVHDAYHMSPLIWASGRGYLEIVDTLLRHNAKVNAGDKFGSTPLIWAARRGFSAIVEKLLEAGANVDTAGMFSWTALIVAVKGNYIDIVTQLLEHKPNINAVNVDGYTALAICCKEGFTEIATRLISAGAYVNMLDKGGDTNLIHAAKVGNLSVVEVLLKRHADIDIQGSDKKTALYWAVEKGHSDVVRSLLNQNPNLELATKDGDTPLMRATRNRNLELVTMLIDRKTPAKVSACDKRGDTALHIAMRARSKAICEVLLRNPKNGYLLYRPNKAGETPYNIDSAQQKSILQQIFGARRLNTQAENENMLGYDLYSSSLADILSEPSLTVPITVGLYARWGSGKSFLLNKLENELRSYEFQWLEPGLKYTWVLFITVCFYSVILGYTLGLATQMWLMATAVVLSSIVLSYSGFYLIRYGSRYYDWDWALDAGTRLDELLSDLKCLLQVIFCHPSNHKTKDGSTPVRFIFSSKTKVSSTGDGGTSIACLLVSIYQALEDEFGFFTTRFYRALRPRQTSSPSWVFRRVCCVPHWSVCVLTIISIMTTIELIVPSSAQKLNPDILYALIMTFATVVGVVLIASLNTWVKLTTSLILPYERNIHRHAARIEKTAHGGLSETLKSEVKVLCDMIHCMDSFTRKQTRLVIIVDGLDSCEQTKVLSVLDAVNVMLSDPGMPFVIVLAVDPHIVIRAIESNVSRSLRSLSLRGYDYLQNIVHLPFFLQNSGLRKVKAAARVAQSGKLTRDREEWSEKEGLTSRRVSNCSALEVKAKRASSKGNQKLRSSESIASSIGNIHQRSALSGGVDLTKVLLNDDYFSDINPRSMRRLMNILYVTGRLMRAFNIDFSWYHLALWVNLTEQWPCQTSWLIHYYETHETEIEDSSPLRSLFERIRNLMPASKELEQLQTMDHDVKKLELCLSSNSHALQIGNLRMFIPFAINLDPHIRRVLQDSYDSQLEQSLQQGITATSISKNSRTQQSADQRLIAQQAVGGFLQPNPPPFGISQLTRSDPMPLNQYAPMMNSDFTHAVLRQSGFSIPAERLTTITVDGVRSMLSEMEGISRVKKPQYQKSIKDHNINGLVLYGCDLQELKAVLGMTFGDWEIFKMHIVQMRNFEMELALEMMRGPGNRNHQPSEDVKHQARPEDKSATERESSKSRKSQTSAMKPNTTSLEKQVTMEENMIIGALETLNEETFEDGNQPCVREMGSVATSLSPILSDAVESPHSTDSTSSDMCLTPCTQHTAASAAAHRPFPIDLDDGQSAEVDCVYIRNTGNSRYSLSPLCTSVPDVEWAPTPRIASGITTATTFHPPATLTLVPNPLCNVQVSAPPSIVSSPSPGQGGGFNGARSSRGKIIDFDPSIGPERPTYSVSGATSPVTKIEGDAHEEEERPHLEGMFVAPLELPTKESQVGKQSAEYRRQLFGRQSPVKDEDRASCD